MIEAHQFVEAARDRGFRRYAGVPCSFLTPFINYVLQDPTLEYVSMANEGDAVALIAGVALAGPAPGEPGSTHRRGITLMQNSGLGNAVSPLTSLTWTFRLPQLLIVTWRGQPGVHDEPQHALMGPVTPAMLDLMEVPWELFPSDADGIGAALDRAIAHMDSIGRPYALLMQKGSVAPHPLRSAAVAGRVAAAAVSTGAASLPAMSAHTAPTPAMSSPAMSASAMSASAMSASAVSANAASANAASANTAVRAAAARPLEARPSRRDALQQVIDHTPAASTAVLASTGHCGRELYAIADRPNQLYMVGSMGCVVPLALGLALARPDLEVLAVDGDGAALMRMGAFATVGAYAPPNLKHLLLDNGVHDSTGGQATVSPRVSFAGVARACGYAEALETDDAAAIGTWLDTPRLDGPRFARLLIRPGTGPDLPRPSISPVEVKTRFMQHFRNTGAC
jgi:phosphonopyruvate decarboxylase